MAYKESCSHERFVTMLLSPRISRQQTEGLGLFGHSFVYPNPTATTMREQTDYHQIDTRVTALSGR